MSEALSRVRVLLVDDHLVVRQGLRAFLQLQPDIEVVGEAAGGAAAVEGATGSRRSGRWPARRPRPGCWC